MEGAHQARDSTDVGMDDSAQVLEDGGDEEIDKDHDIPRMDVDDDGSDKEMHVETEDMQDTNEMVTGSELQAMQASITNPSNAGQCY